LFQSDGKTASFLFQSRGKTKKTAEKNDTKLLPNLQKSSIFVPSNMETSTAFTFISGKSFLNTRENVCRYKGNVQAKQRLSCQKTNTG